MDQLRTMLIEDQSVAASEVVTKDLPINPLSHLWLTFKGLNATDEATLAEVLATVTKITVSELGQSAYDLSMADLFAWNCWYFKQPPTLMNRVATDNATRALTLALPFGRRLYDPAECYHGTRKGNLQIRIEFAASQAAIDGWILSLAAVQLLDASPAQHIRVTTKAMTPTATGDTDVDLPIGNTLAGLMLWGTTVVTTTAWTNTIEKIKLLVNDKGSQIESAHWEDLHGAMVQQCGYLGDSGAAAGNDDLVKYAFVDFMRNQGDDFLIPTAGLSSLMLRITAGDTNPLRVLPIELVRT